MPEQGATPGPANAGSSVADVSGGISGTGASGPGNIKPPMTNNGSSAPLMSPPEQQGKTVAGGILNGKAISLPKPPYPAIARSARASGTVVVQVIVNEQGDVMSAHAISGHPLLQSSAVQAAWAAKFTPTRVEGQPVKVSGKITYNFVL
jgi:protein TonB